jgi:nuclear-control-of-ATPase protein 2
MHLLKAGPDALGVGGTMSTTTTTTTTTTHHHRHPRGATRRRLAAALRATAPLPVAGIDPAEAGGALHAVRRALDTRRMTNNSTTPDLWLAALCCAQEASDRLLRDLDAASASAAFWRARMRAGGHGAFMLLGRGPAQFASGVLLGLGRGAKGRSDRQQQEALRIGGGARGGGVSAHAIETATTTTTTATTAPTSPSATDRIQERIDALDALSRSLAAAVAKVHRAADLLRLELPAGTAGAAAAAAARAAAPSAAAIAPSAPLASADPAAAERAISTCLAQLRGALEDVRAAAAEAGRRGEGDEDGTGAVAVAARPLPPPPPRRNTTTTSTAQHDLAAVVALLEAGGAEEDACPQQQEQEDDVTTLLISLVLPPADEQLPCNAADALDHAARRALARGPLAPPPAWARMPSRLQRHWLRYAAAAACAGAGAAWLYRHSRWGGSDDLDRWSRDAAASLSSAWRAHVVDPLAAVRRELFATLRDRPAIVSPAEFAEDREALLRMLRAFERDHRALVVAEGGGEGSAAAIAAASPAPDAPSSSAPLDASDDTLLISRGMARVMDTYERELRSPLRNLFAGSLARAVLIQVQRLKLDTEAAMLELDQILRANELSLTLVAAVPSLVIAGLVVRGCWRLLLVRAPADPKREAVAARMAMGCLERALSAARAARVAAAEEEEFEGGSSGAVAAREANASAVAVAEGLCVHALHRAFGEASRLYRGRGGGGGGGGGGAWSSSASRRSEWPQLREGMVQMARPPLSGAGKLEYSRYLTRTFALFQA